MLTSTGTAECDIDALPQFISRGDIVFDIGANDGAYTIAMSKLVGPSGHVYAFEPIPHNLDILHTVIDRLGLCNVTVLPIALGDVACRLPMTVPTVGFGGGYSLARFANAGEAVHHEVECETIDSLIARKAVQVPSFLKCDVEGAESKVATGAANLIANHHPNWLMEAYQPWTFDVMHGFGYHSFVYEVHRTLEPVEQRLTNACNYYFLRDPLIPRCIPTLA